MSKAFDSLHPALLLSKLEAYGFQESTIQLLNSYLNEQKYQVKIARHVSSSRFVSRGCSQGSALGPLLWNVFQNDLSLCLTANLSMYADDHQIYHAGADQTAVTLQLKDSANLATMWYLLAGNLKKYQVLNLGFNQNDSNICVNNVEIETKDNIILLGVVLDSNLNFSEHIISICKKASQRIGVLMRLPNLIPRKSKLILFKSVIIITILHVLSPSVAFLQSERHSKA